MFKARMKFAKEGRAKYISHLDLMRTMQRSMARCGMPLWFTEGFNQHAYVSVALPLSTGFSSECEFLDFNLLPEEVPVDAVESLNTTFPEGLRALEIYPLSDGGRKIGEIAYSRYCVTYSMTDTTIKSLEHAVKQLLSRDNIEIVKRSKRSEKTVNMMDFIREHNVFTDDCSVKVNIITCAGNNNLSPDYLTKALNLYATQFDLQDVSYHRIAVYDADLQEFR